jgi:hypothetical protein
MVCTPEEALNTFLYSSLDLLVLGDFVVEAQAGEAGERARLAAAERITIGVG